MDNNDDTTVAGSMEGGGGSESLPPGMIVSLEVLEGPGQGTRHQITKSRVTIGRKDTDIILADTTVSGKHAVLESVKGKLFITDMGSTNGTTLNGEPVESARCVNMDEIGLGDSRLLLSVVEDRYGAFMPDAPDEEAPESRYEQTDPTMVMQALPNPDLDPSIHVVLDFVDGPDKGRKMQITHKSTVVGRGDRADIKVGDNTVSNRHCQIEVHNKDKMTLKDLASANGTRLNDHYISAVKIRHGDRVRVGNTTFRILIHIKR